MCKRIACTLAGLPEPATHHTTLGEQIQAPMPCVLFPLLDFVPEHNAAGETDSGALAVAEEEEDTCLRTAVARGLEWTRPLEGLGSESSPTAL